MDGEYGSKTEIGQGLVSRHSGTAELERCDGLQRFGGAGNGSV